MAAQILEETRVNKRGLPLQVREVTAVDDPVARLGPPLARRHLIGHPPPNVRHGHAPKDTPGDLALRIELETTPDRIITVPFSAWRYEKEEHLIVPLIDSIREAVMKWSETRDPKVAETARKGAALLGRVTKALLAGLSLKVGVPGTLDVSFEANKALSAAAAAGEEAEAARVPRSSSGRCAASIAR